MDDHLIEMAKATGPIIMYSFYETKYIYQKLNWFTELLWNYQFFFIKFKVDLLIELNAGFRIAFGTIIAKTKWKDSTVFVWQAARQYI